jgi:hypothetical protein
MAKVSFKPGDIDSDVAKAAGPLQVMTYPKGLTFKLEVEFDAKMEKEIGKDALLAQDMWLGVKKVYDDLVKRIGENLRTTDRGAVELRNNKEVDKLKKLIEVVNKNIVGAAKIAEEAAEKAVIAHYEGLKKKRKEYTKYKIKIAVTITGASVGLATSIGLLAATGFSGGASGALGIVAMVKSVAVIATEVASAAQTVEQSIGTLRTQIQVVQKIWGEKKGKAQSLRGHANEIAAAALKEFLGAPMPSAKQCQSNLETATSKLDGVVINTHDMAKKVMKLMTDSSAMQKDFLDKANAKLAKHPDPQALRKYGPRVIDKLQKAVKPGNDAIKGLVLEIDLNLRRADKCKDDLGKLAIEVAEINKIRNSSKFTENAYKVLDNSLAMANNILAGALSGNGLVSGAQSIAENVVPVVGLFAYDKISAVVFADGDLKKALW